MTVLQITVPEKKEKAVRLLLKELGVTVKKVSVKPPMIESLKTAVKEMKEIKAGELKSVSFDDFLNEL
jgi:cysteine synthase